jgi:hypothetical protein
MAEKTSKTATGADGKPAKTGRLRQIRETYRMAKKVDPRIGLISLGSGLLVFLVFFALGWFVILDPIIMGFLGLATGLLVAAFIFGRRAERAAYAQVEGQPGAAAAVLNALRRGWIVTPAIAVTRNQDIVHRAVSRCGIVLVGEGVPSRLANLLANEKRRHARVAPDAPVYDVIVGDAEGQVPLRGLNKHLMKLPRSLRPAEVTDINYRLKALQISPVPIPKGPIPMTTKVPRSAKMR